MAAAFFNTLGIRDGCIQLKICALYTHACVDCGLQNALECPNILLFSWAFEMINGKPIMLARSLGVPRHSTSVHLSVPCARFQSSSCQTYGLPGVCTQSPKATAHPPWLWSRPPGQMRTPSQGDAALGASAAWRAKNGAPTPSLTHRPLGGAPRPKSVSFFLAGSGRFTLKLEAPA